MDKIVTINGKRYRKIVTTMGELQENDLTLGSDNKWHTQTPLPIHKAKEFYQINFKYNDGRIGSIKCDGEHQWTFFYGKHSILDPFTLNTSDIYKKINFIVGKHIGSNDGPILKSVEDIKGKGYDESVRCLEIDGASDHLFNIIADSQTKDKRKLSRKYVLTHNCRFRISAGVLGLVASRMAFDSTKGTTVRNIKGSGLVKADAEYFHLQIYYNELGQLKEWFRKRGLNERGFDLNTEVDPYIDPNAKEDLNIDLGEDEELELKEEKIHVEFNGIEKEIDNTKDQKFDEV